MLGLTGGIASGKSTVSNRLRGLGAFIADADEIARGIVELPSVRGDILKQFGPSVFNAEGGLDRAALASKAFASAQAAARLNAITHPAIKERAIALAKAAENSGEYPLVFIDAPLLIESGLHEVCSGVWLVTADRELRIRRIIERDGLTREQAELRISRQMKDEAKALFATRTIFNNGTLDELISKVDAAFEEELSIRGFGA